MTIRDVEQRKKIIEAHVENYNRFIVSALAMTDELWDTLSRIFKQGDNMEKSQNAGKLIRSAYSKLQKEKEAAGKVAIEVGNKKVSFYNK